MGGLLSRNQARQEPDNQKDLKTKPLRDSRKSQTEVKALLEETHPKLDPSSIDAVLGVPIYDYHAETLTFDEIVVIVRDNTKRSLLGLVQVHIVCDVLTKNRRLPLEHPQHCELIHFFFLHRLRAHISRIYR